MIADTIRFLNALFCPYGDEALRLEVRPLNPQWMEGELYPNGDSPWNWASKTPYGTRKWFCMDRTGIQNAAQHAVRMGKTYQTYFGVLPRIGAHGTQEDVQGAWWAFVDVDGGSEGVEGSIRRIKRADIPLPHIAIKSGGGVHAYYRLAEHVPLPEAEDRQAFKYFLKRICLAIGGEASGAHADTSACEVARVLRVPGTFNLKRRNEPRPVELIRFEPTTETHTATWWKANLPAIPAPPPPRYTPNTPMDDRSCEGLLRWARRPYPEGNRHKDLCGAAAWLVRDCHLTKTQAEELLRLKASVSFGARRIPDDEIRSMVEWL